MGEVLMSSMGKNRYKIETVGTAVALASTAPCDSYHYLMQKDEFEAFKTLSVNIGQGQ